MIETLKEIVMNTRAARPLVHAITNNVTVNDCANIILAAYGAPTMAQDEREVEEITALSNVARAQPWRAACTGSDAVGRKKSQRAGASGRA